MFSLNQLYVADRQRALRAEAAEDRLARRAQRLAKPFSLADAVKSVWSLLSGPADRPALPTIGSSTFASPYRS